MFVQQGQFHSSDASYSVSFSLDDLNGEVGYTLTLELNLTFQTDNQEISKVLIKPREAHTVDPSIIHLDENGKSQAEIRVVAEKQSTELGFELVPWIPRDDPQEGRLYSEHVKLLSAEKLSLCAKALEEGMNEEVWAETSDLYDGDAPYFLLDFTSETRRVLDYKSFVTLMSEFAVADNRYGATVGESRAQFFKNMIIGESGGYYHRIKNYDELREKLDFFAEQKSLAEVDEEYAIWMSLKQLESDGEFERLYSIMKQLQIAEHRPDILSEHQLEFYIAKSKIERENVPIAALNQLSTSADVDDYEAAVENAKIAAESFEETAALWRELLHPALSDSYNELQFILGRYLHWKTRSYTNDDMHLNFAPILYRGAAKFSESVGDEKYRQLSRYNQHLRRGFGNLADGYLTGAEEEFQKALQIATNESGEWFEQKPDLMVTPIQYMTIAEVSGGPIEYDSEEESISLDIQEVESDDLRKKLSLITERIETLQSVFEDVDISIEKTIHSLRAKRNQLLANQRIKAQQYELAIEAIDEIIRLHSEVGSTQKRDRSIGLRKHVSAVLAETQGKFEEAADYYDDVQEQTAYASTEQQQQFHRIRGKTCEAKAALLANNIEEANHLVSEITESVHEVKYEAQDLSVLIDTLGDFQNSEITGIDTALNQISDSKSKDHGMGNLYLSFDYKPALTAVLSAQRLKTKGVDEELLRKFIRVGVAESFTPSSSDDIISKMHLSDISLDTVWRHNLPIYTHRSLERIEIKENSVATGDYSDVASKLLSTFEKYLEVIVEFYGKQQNDDWKSLLTNNPEKDLTLGDLAKFFQSGELEQEPFDRYNDIKRRFDENIFRGMQLVEIRNELDHGHIDKLSEKEYQSLKSIVVNILEITGPETPIVIRPMSRNTFGSSTIYSCELFWSRPQRQASIETEADLNVEEPYFMSPSAQSKLGERDIVHIHHRKMVPCDERRVTESVVDSE